MAAAHALTHETNALIDTPSDLIRATTSLITLPCSLIAPSGWLITAHQLPVRAFLPCT
jgi:hypothetical protein